VRFTANLEPSEVRATKVLRGHLELGFRYTSGSGFQRVSEFTTTAAPTLWSDRGSSIVADASFDAGMFYRATVTGITLPEAGATFNANAHFEAQRLGCTWMGSVSLTAQAYVRGEAKVLSRRLGSLNYSPTWNPGRVWSGSLPLPWCAADGGGPVEPDASTPPGGDGGTGCERHGSDCDACNNDPFCGFCMSASGQGRCMNNTERGSACAAPSQWLDSLNACRGVRCSRYTSCGACADDPACGWCAASNRCLSDVEAVPAALCAPVDYHSATCGG
jgi:hypothetical protein